MSCNKDYVENIHRIAELRLGDIMAIETERIMNSIYSAAVVRMHYTKQKIFTLKDIVFDEIYIRDVVVKVRIGDAMVDLYMVDKDDNCTHIILTGNDSDLQSQILAAIDDYKVKGVRYDIQWDKDIIAKEEVCEQERKANKEPKEFRPVYDKLNNVQKKIRRKTNRKKKKRK